MSRWRSVRRSLALMGATAFVLTIHMLLLATSSPVIRTAWLALPGWPAGGAPLRIALFSDIHVAAPSDTPERLTGLVRLIDAQHPDLILIAGDFLGTSLASTGHYTVEQTIAPLIGLHAPLGVLAVPGNHDRYYHALGAVEAALAQVGIPLLVNAVARRGPVAILGFDDYSTGHRDAAGVIARWRSVGGVPIALTHDPAMLLHIPDDAGIRLRLAGHTHCGQISPPPFGPLVSSSDAGMRYVCGPVREPGRVTIVTAGIGTSILPMRLGASPDLWVITVGPA
jgi:predicted MPP superfamily phosphohydrolase